MLLFRRPSIFALLCVFAAPASTPHAQVLARPGWAGSGVVAEAWWRRAVFYRLDPARFQDSDGDGVGDLPGVVQRLDYLESLGIDAVVLDGRYDPAGLEDLIAEASRHRLRILLTVSPEMQAGGREPLLGTVHGWLGAGAAGVWVPKPQGDGGQANSSYQTLVAALNGIVRGFPGERVLLTDPAPQTASLAPAPVRGHARRRDSATPFAGAPAGQLTTAAVFPVQVPSAAALRQSLATVSEDGSTTTEPLLRFAGDPRTKAPDAAADAALLLASRGAAMFNFGDEIGLNLSTQIAAGVAYPAVMQWTPLNLRQAPPAGDRAAEAPVSPDGVTAFGAYHPYVPPPRGLNGLAPTLPRVAVDRNIPAALPDPNSLPGFTTGALPAAPTEGVTINVTTEDRDPRSLLNAYRQLIGLHHGNATLRNGSEYVLHRDEQGAVVWVRRAPAGSRTVANVVVAANLSDLPVRLSLDDDLEGLGMRPGTVRPLFAWSSQPLTGETTAALQLPGHAVFIGEIYHGGGTPTEHRRHQRRGRR